MKQQITVKILVPHTNYKIHITSVRQSHDRLIVFCKIESFNGKPGFSISEINDELEVETSANKPLQIYYFLTEFPPEEEEAICKCTPEDQDEFYTPFIYMTDKNTTDRWSKEGASLYKFKEEDPKTANVSLQSELGFLVKNSPRREEKKDELNEEDNSELQLKR